MQAIDFRIFDHVATPMFFVEVGEDRIPRFVTNNTAHVEMSGMVVTRSTAMDTFPARLGKRLYERQLEVVRTRKPLVYTLWFTYPAGERELRTTLSPVLNENGEVQYIIGTMIEETEAQAEREARLRSEADHLNLLREKEQFLAMAAHDLRTPLRQVDMIGKMLGRDVDRLDPAQQELVDMLSEVTERASAAISDILSYAQTISLTTAASVIDFQQLCDEIAILLDPQSNHDFVTRPVTVEVDEMVLKVVLRNLMENAIKHAHRDSVSLRMSVCNGGEGMVEFHVQDNGSGFSDPSLAFLDGAAFRQEHGFGLLGVRRIVRVRGGEILADNPEDGTGALIRFTLPGRIVADSA